jgi:hypothetical protein
MLHRLMLLIALVIHLPSASAALLGSGNVDYGFGDAHLPNFWWGAPVETTVTVALLGANDHAQLASEIFTVGSPSFTTTFSSGSTFDALALLLTNGQNDSLTWSMLNYWGGVSTGPMESVFFAGSPYLTNGIDFAGATIDRVDFSITNQSTSPGTDPNGDGIWTDWKFGIAMDVYGTPAVPEPTSAALVLLALGGLVSIRQFARRGYSGATG